jgi:hypothetical protein
MPMQKLNKKLFADFKKTPLDRKFGFIKKNAEVLLAYPRLYARCVVEFKKLRSEFEAMPNSLKMIEQFEDKLLRLRRLPKKLENQKKEEEFKAAEKTAQEAAQLKAWQEELQWKGRLENFNTKIEVALIEDQNVMSEEFFEAFKDLKSSRPQTIEKSLPENYLEYLENHPPYISYKKTKDDELKAKLKQKKTRNRWVLGGTAVVGIISLLSWVVTALQKKSSGLKTVKETHMVYDSNGKLTGTEEKTYQVPNLNSAQEQDRLYVMNMVKKQSKDFYESISKFDKNNKVQIEKSGFYLSSLNGLMETLDPRDVEGHLLISTELEKIEKNKKNIVMLFIKSDQSFNFSSDPEEIDRQMNLKDNSPEMIIHRQYQFFHLLARLYAKTISCLIFNTGYLNDSKSVANQLATDYAWNIKSGLAFNPRSKELKAMQDELRKIAKQY